jgi:flavin reductase (DIM6/NTAB) family NADH-FMN oxidoreductase RutF
MEVDVMRIDPGALSPSRRYFLMTSCIIPRPIAWVGTVNEGGGFNLAPFSYFNGLASTPPLLALGIGPHPDKHEKDTLRNIRRAHELTVNIPEFGQVAQVESTSANLPYGENEFASAGLSPLLGELVAAPRISSARISMECVLNQDIPLGDGGGAILLVEVKLFHIDDAILDERSCVDPTKFKALARMGGGRYAPVGDVFKVE